MTETHRQNDSTQDALARRNFLRRMAGGAGLALAPGVILYSVGEARPLDQAASQNVLWGMLIDTGKCKPGCTACVDACNTENGLADTGHPATDAQWIRKLEVTDPRGGETRSLPMMCQHCANPPCVDACPTGASFKRADGIVLVDKHSCIGCRYCMVACPYKARSFVHEPLHDQKPWAPRGKGTVESCTFCVHRVDDGRSPACVESCATKAQGALTFGDLNDPDSDISRALAETQNRQIRADLGLDPGVRYSGI
jgi:molybdopterin-containing oxidoreductase family iron-sulfur binding subunit